MELSSQIEMDTFRCEPVLGWRRSLWGPPSGNTVDFGRCYACDGAKGGPSVYSYRLNLNRDQVFYTVRGSVYSSLGNILAIITSLKSGWQNISDLIAIFRISPVTSQYRTLIPGF